MEIENERLHHVKDDIKGELETLRDILPTDDLEELMNLSNELSLLRSENNEFRTEVSELRSSSGVLESVVREADTWKLKFTQIEEKFKDLLEQFREKESLIQQV